MKSPNKVAVVTGASTGIGRAIAVEFTKRTSHIFLLARSKDKLEETKRLVEKNGGKAEVVVCDLTKIPSINAAIASIKQKISRVDVLVNVAGIWHGKNEVYANTAFETFSQQVIVDTYMVGTVAPTLLAHGLVPLMKKGSNIINISGTFESGAKGWLPYFVSKRAIEDLTIGLSQELRDKRIQVNAISPSDVATEEYKKYFPQYIADAISPLEIAKFAVHICSDNAITGKIFVLKKGKEPFEKFHA